MADYFISDFQEWSFAEEPDAPLQSMTIHEDDDNMRDTGILDAEGNPIYFRRERGKLGFL